MERRLRLREDARLLESSQHAVNEMNGYRFSVNPPCTPLTKGGKLSCIASENPLSSSASDSYRHHAKNPLIAPLAKNPLVAPLDKHSLMAPLDKGGWGDSDSEKD
jgi:hypothetical protein